MTTSAYIFKVFTNMHVSTYFGRFIKQLPLFIHIHNRSENVLFAMGGFSCEGEVSHP